MYMKAFFNDLSIHEACFHCKHKVKSSCADITLADFWGIDKLRPEIDDDKGTSLLIIHTKRGEEYIRQIKGLFLLFEEIDPDSALEENQYIIHSPKPHKMYGAFMKNFYFGMSFYSNIEVCLKRSLITKIMNIFLKSK